MKLPAENEAAASAALLAGIPGGIAVCHLKNDGHFTADFVSDGIAKIFGYQTPEELLLLSRGTRDVLDYIAPEDIPSLREAIRRSQQSGQPLNLRLRIRAKDGSYLLTRMDANPVKPGEPALTQDDLAAWYTVLTPVSEEAQGILRDSKRLHKLIDEVPTGIGIYEIRNGIAVQEYMNNAFYTMLGSSREERSAYFGENAMSAAHPEDMPKLHNAIAELLAGAEHITVNYRLRLPGDKWFCLHLKASVVERSPGRVRIYGAFSDYNEISRAQKELERSKNTLQIALDAAKVLSWRYDYRLDTITDSGTLGLAYHLPKVVKNVSQTILEMGFIAPESRDDFLELFRGIATERTVCSDTMTTVQGENGPLWYHQIYTPTFDEAGHYLDSIGIAIDVTAQKQREQHYRNQLRLQQIATKDALFKVSLNLTRNFVTSYAGEPTAYTRYADYSSADALLRSVLRAGVAEEDLAKFEPVRDLHALLQSYQNGKQHLEIRCRLQDESVWLRLLYDIVKNPYNGDIEAVSSIHDITQETRAELVMRKLIAVDYRSILAIDRKTGEIVPFKLIEQGNPLDDILSRQLDTANDPKAQAEFLRQYCPPDTAEQIILENSFGYIDEQLRQKPYYESTYALLFEGKDYHYRAIYTHLEKNKRTILCAVQDVTATYQKELRQKAKLADALLQAKSANRAKTAFLHRVSHDMRTPLNGILGLAALMKQQVHNTAALTDLDEMETAGHYLLGLVNDTLDMSRIESGHLELHPAVCNSRALFDNTLSLVRAAMVGKDLVFHLHREELPVIPLYVDATRVEQILLNVISNAVKFTPEGGSIDVFVSLVSLSETLLVEKIVVRDTGIGISQAFLPHIFEPFSQEDVTRTSAYQGTGLGMAVTKQLLDLMNSEITVESEVGSGTCCTLLLHLPTAAAIPADAADQSAAPPPAQPCRLDGKRILLCEDHPLNAKIATRLLTCRGALVEHAENGASGVTLFENSEPGYYDAVLMDIRMPVMDGLDAARAIRALAARRSDAATIPIIAMTANAFADDIAQSRAAGMNAHLSKPIQIETLYRTLDELLNRRPEP